MSSDSEDDQDWDVDNGDGAAEDAAMGYIFDNVKADDSGPGFVQTTSSGNTKYWVPTCDDSIKPIVGMKFVTIVEAIDFYTKYGATVGFDVRKGSSRTHTDETCLNRYMVCNRSGFPEESKGQGKRKRSSIRVGCNAYLYLKFKGNDGYVIENMDDRHTHSLLQEGSNQFLKANRKLDFGHQRFMINCAKSNMGPAMTHRLMKIANGGARNGGPLLHDCKNFKRDVMAHISPADAQMVVDRFIVKQKATPGFYFAYDVNKDNQLIRLFWCDPIARANYAAFGDVLSFDSTYRTNKYSLVFAPFTGINNHRKAVTFGAGLLLNEDEPSYTWLFEHFKKAMCKDPIVIVTYQDPSMKKSMPLVFPNTRHRFCMWHIMMEVPREVPSSACADQEFRKRFNVVVWNYECTIPEFEKNWNELLVEFKLDKHEWLKLMYSLRELWIPASFRDVLLGGLIRTTSISESANNLFGRYSGRHLTIVDLMMHFDSAMDAQRHASAKLDMECESHVRVYESRLDIEKHASTVYTKKVFGKIHAEIVDGVYTCHVISEVVENRLRKYIVREDKFGNFDVVFDEAGETSKCSCNMFHQVGIPCGHIFATYKYMRLNTIPVAMILPRWTKGARQVDGVPIGDEVLKQCADMEAKKMMLNNLWSTIYSTIGVVEGDTTLISDLIMTMTEKQAEYMGKLVLPAPNMSKKQAFVEKYVGVQPPEQIVVQPPPKAKNKGSGRRMVGSLEKATKKAQKPLRKCGRCGKMASHDKRNCQEFLGGEDELDADDEFDDESE